VVCVGLVLTVPGVVAGTLKADDRKLGLSLARVDLDRGDALDVDLGTADGSELALTMGWMRGRVIELGLRAGYADLEVSDDAAVGAGESLSGFIYGGFISLHLPTAGSLSPFFALHVDLLKGDLGDVFEWGWGPAVGLEVHSGRSWGWDVRLERVELNGTNVDFSGGYPGMLGRDYGPDGSLLRVVAGAQYRF
jgi:hypothetical protein